MISNIKYQKINYFSKTVKDYLNQDDKIKPFYNHFPKLENFKKQIDLKQNFSKDSRKILVYTLNNQYKNIKISDETNHNINLLLKENTFTITTGHQLNLFTGPLYFLYKIISTINLTEELTIAYPKNNFVPIYWMATEDHDFEEIQFFNFKKNKITWNKDSKGAVGRLSTIGLDEVLLKITNLFGKSKNANYLIALFKESYLEHNNLADATRFLANELFKNYGLVILDADNSALKQQFTPFVKEELLHKTAFKEVSKTIKSFSENYKIQVNPRELNLFYLTDDLRERIVFEGNLYKINNTSIRFSELEILEELKNYPERFSPNVIMRPLYQEVILPNLCYVGGGGELAYWFELNTYFEKIKVPFPILLLRNSVLIQSKKQHKKLVKLNVTIEDLFLNQVDLINKKVKENTNLDLNFSKQMQFLENQFLELKILATKTDKSFIGAVNAQEKKQLNGLKSLEKRLLKAEKRQLKDIMSRITKIQNELFPNKSLQERTVNFSELYLEYGSNLITVLKENLKPLLQEFTVITL